MNVIQKVVLKGHICERLTLDQWRLLPILHPSASAKSGSVEDIATHSPFRITRTTGVYPFRVDAGYQHELLAGRPIMHSWHIVGDSHVASFRQASEVGLINRPCTFTEVGGATAVGLRNPNSMTDGVGIFEKALLPALTASRPVIHLGEVDCGFVIWYRAKKYNESIKVQVEQSISAYFKFVDKLVAHGYPSIVISGATLPTIRDGQDWGEVANARREVTTSLLERTDLTLTYNAKLSAAAQHRALPFIDIAETILDKDTHVVAENFRHPDPTNHHLDPEKVGPLWASELNRIEREMQKGIMFP